MLRCTLCCFRTGHAGLYSVGIAISLKHRNVHSLQHAKVLHLTEFLLKPREEECTSQKLFVFTKLYTAYEVIFLSVSSQQAVVSVDVSV